MECDGGGVEEKPRMRGVGKEYSDIHQWSKKLNTQLFFFIFEGRDLFFIFYFLFYVFFLLHLFNI